MGRQVIAELIARCGERMRADKPLDGRQSRPVPADDRRWHRARSLRRRCLNLPSKRPHSLRLLLFREAPIDAGDFLDDALADRMLEIENLFERPVQVIRHVRDLLEEAVGRVRHNPPRRPPAMSTVNWCLQSGQVTAACVCPSWLIRR